MKKIKKPHIRIALQIPIDRTQFAVFACPQSTSRVPHRAGAAQPENNPVQYLHTASGLIGAVSHGRQLQ